MEQIELANIVEAALLASGRPLSLENLLALFPEDARPERQEIRQALDLLTENCQGRGIELHQVSSGFRLQVKEEYAPWVGKLWDERPPRYSRALLETLSLIAYKQPITRAEIEEVRGVTVSTNIMKTLQEREWVRVVGHRDVPGHPALYATTKEFLDYFGLKGLNELPSLAEIRDIESINAELDLEDVSSESVVAIDTDDSSSVDHDAAEEIVNGITEEMDVNSLEEDSAVSTDAEVSEPLEESR